MELIGVHFMDFRGESGDRITGAKLHCLDEEVPAGKGMGRKVYSVFATSEVLPKVPAIGSQLEFIYNMHGRLKRVNVLE